MRVASVVLALLFAASAARAQTPDSTATLDARPTPADSLASDALAAPRLPRASVAPSEAPVGRPVAPVPAVTPALGLEPLLDAPARDALAPSAFVYRVGAPQRAAGVAVDGLDPSRPALLLDGRPQDDLLTGAPRYDLLPAEALGPTVAADTRLGRALGVLATLRTFRVARPVTELRYHTGGDGIQSVSGTHAQTRRPPAFLRGGSPDARLTTSLHVATRNSVGPLTAGQMRHTDAVGRLLLTRPSLSLELGDLYVDRTDGARRGVTATSFAGLFDGSAQPRDASASRRTLRNELWATARVRLAPDPLTARLAWTTQRLVYTPAPGDTTRAHAQRVAFTLEQPLRRGPLLRALATWEADPSGGTDPLGNPGARWQGHVEASDTLGMGPARLALAAGAHLADGRAWPSAAALVQRGVAFAGVRLAGAAPGRIETAGLAGRVLPRASATERTVLAEAGLSLGRGDWTTGVRAVAHRRWDASLLVAQGDTAFAFTLAPSPLDRLAVTLRGTWRDAATRGVYARWDATAGTALRPDRSTLHQREADALPTVYGTARLGTRATQVGGVLDLDLAATLRGWTAFRSRIVEPATGLLALPEPGTPLGYVVPARGTLDLAATATFSARASVYLGLDNALGQAVGSLVVPGEPVPGPTLRFGVFWALLD